MYVLRRIRENFHVLDEGESEFTTPPSTPITSQPSYSYAINDDTTWIRYRAGSWT